MAVEKVQPTPDLGIIEHLQVPRRSEERKSVPEGREVAVPKADGKRGGKGGLEQKDFESIAKEMNKIVTIFNTRVAFSIDQDIGRMIIKVIDNETNQVISQIPPDEMLQLIKKMDSILGVLIAEKA